MNAKAKNQLLGDWFDAQTEEEKEKIQEAAKSLAKYSRRKAGRPSGLGKAGGLELVYEIRRLMELGSSKAYLKECSERR